MPKSKLISSAGLTSLFLGAALFLGSCTAKITEEQLAQLKELYTKEKSLSESIDKKKDEKSKLEAELRARKDEQKKCQDEVDFIKQKLSLWPDIWPDWKPEVK